MATLAPAVFKQYLDDNGDPIADGYITAKDSVTSNDKATYTSAAGTTAHPTQIPLSSAGRTSFWTEPGTYDFRVYDSAGNLIDEELGVNGGSSGGAESVQTVSSIAALKALPSGDTNYVDVSGYYAAGDNRLRRFRWDASSTASDNGGTILTPDSGPGSGRWIDVETVSFSVKDFGAKGDGSTDDASFISAANTYIASLGKGGELVFNKSEDEYAVGSNITFTVPVRFEEGAELLGLTSDRTITFDTFSAGKTKYFGANILAVFPSGSTLETHAEWWGAVGDGVTDDEAAINKAIVASDTVKLLDKTYAVEGEITLKTNSKMYGMGFERTIILELNDFTASPGPGRMVYGTGLSDCVISDIHFKGSGTAYSGSDGDRYGVFITSASRTKIDSCKVSNFERGIFYYNSNTDCWITNCYGTNCFQDALGAYATSGNENYRITISGNKCYNNPSDTQYPAGIRFEETYNSVISLNTVSNSGQGIRVENSCQNTVSGNTCFENNKNGIQLYNSAKRNTVSGNVCYDNNTGYITSKGAIKTMSVGAAGSGYSAGEYITLTLPGDTGAVAAIVKIETVGGSGEVTAISFDSSSTNVNRGWHYVTGTVATTGGSGTGCTVSVDSVASRIEDTTPTRDGNVAKSHSGIELQNDCQNNTIIGNTCYNSTSGNGNQFYGICINNRNFTDLTEASSYNVVTGNICVNNTIAEISDRGFYNQVLNNVTTLNNE